MHRLVTLFILVGCGPSPSHAETSDTTGATDSGDSGDSAETGGPGANPPVCVDRVVAVEGVPPGLLTALRLDADPSDELVGVRADPNSPGMASLQIGDPGGDDPIVFALSDPLSTSILPSFGDIDADGRDDAMWTLGDGIHWFRGGDLGFVDAGLVSGEVVVGNAIMDFDGDGRGDVFTISGVDIRGHVGAGDGSFEWAWTWPVANPMAFASVRTVVHNRSGHTLGVALWPLNCDFCVETGLAMSRVGAGGTIDPTIPVLEPDGNPELVLERTPNGEPVLISRTAANQLLIYTVTNNQLRADASWPGESLQRADFDLDDIVDVVIDRGDTLEIRLSEDGYATARSVPVPAGIVANVRVVADFDGDGRDDLVVGDGTAHVAIMSRACA